MGTFEKELLYEISWRTNEISILRTIPYLFPLSKRQKLALERHTIPAIYSLWEGFVVTTFEVYVREINSYNLSAEKLNLCILTHAIDAELQLNNGRTDFEKKQKLIEGLSKYYNTAITIVNKLPKNLMLIIK